MRALRREMVGAVRYRLVITSWNHLVAGPPPSVRRLAALEKRRDGESDLTVRMPLHVEELLAGSGLPVLDG